MTGSKAYAVVLIVLLAGCGTIPNTIFDHTSSKVQRVVPSQGERFIVGTMYTDSPGSYSEANVSVLYPNLTVANTTGVGTSAATAQQLYDIDVIDSDGDGSLEVFACGRQGDLTLKIFRLHANDTLSEVFTYTNSTGGNCMAGFAYGNHYAYTAFEVVTTPDSILHHSDFNGTELENLTTAFFPNTILYAMASGEQDGERLFVIGGLDATTNQGYLSVWNFSSTDGWVEKANTLLTPLPGAFNFIKSVDLFDIDDDGGFEVLVSGTSLYEPVAGFGSTNFMCKRGAFLGVYNLDDLSEVSSVTNYEHETIIMDEAQGVDVPGFRGVVVTGWEKDGMADMYDRLHRFIPLNETRGFLEFYGYYPTGGLVLFSRYHTASNSSLASTDVVDLDHIYTVGSAVDYTKFWMKRLQQTNMTVEGVCTPFTSNSQTVGSGLYPLHSTSIRAFARDSCNQTNETSEANITVV